MAGTKEGGMRAAQKNKERDPDFYFKIGQKGGKTRTPNSHLKGYGSRPDLASEAGRRGGTNSRRGAQGRLDESTNPILVPPPTDA